MFGSLCNAHNYQRKKDKFDFHSRRCIFIGCIFIGYSYAKGGWKVYDLETGEAFISRNVIFHEEKFSYFDDQMKGITERLPNLLRDNHQFLGDEFEEQPPIQLRQDCRT